jgi:hypothetical protein
MRFRTVRRENCVRRRIRACTAASSLDRYCSRFSKSSRPPKSARHTLLSTPPRLPFSFASVASGSACAPASAGEAAIDYLADPQHWIRWGEHRRLPATARDGCQPLDATRMEGKKKRRGFGPLGGCLFPSSLESFPRPRGQALGWLGPRLAPNTERGQERTRETSGTPGGCQYFGILMSRLHLSI